MIGVDLAIAVPPHPAPMAAKAPPLEALSATEAIKSVAPTPVAFLARVASVGGGGPPRSLFQTGFVFLRLAAFGFQPSNRVNLGCLDDMMCSDAIIHHPKE